jgi:hypothetical protein
MAIGDITEMPSMSVDGDLLQVLCTWRETGTRPAGSGTRPTYALIGVRVVNDTEAPASLLLAAPDGTQYWYQVAPPGTTFTLTNDQQAKFVSGASISLGGE